DVLGALAAHLREHVVEREPADVDAGRRAGDPIETQPGVVDRFPGGFEQEPLLRVERVRFARRDAKELGIELLDVVFEKRAVPDVNLAWSFAILAVIAAPIPPVAWDFTDRILPRADELPQLIRRPDSSGHPTSDTDDRQRETLLRHRRSLLTKSESYVSRFRGGLCNRGSSGDPCWLPPKFRWVQSTRESFTATAPVPSIRANNIPRRLAAAQGFIADSG